ncbi:hypothetical protein GCM10027174_17660 [Salinifilum aidingensis]
MNPKLKAVFQLASTVGGVVTLQRRLREAKADRDKLVFVDVVVTGLSLITGTALALRELRKGEDK